MAKIGIVISNYNGWQDTVACLQSLQKQSFYDFEIILLDDASTNDSVNRLQQLIPEDVIFLPQKQNIGFAAINNIGIQRALDEGVDYVLLLNNDTVCAPDMLEKLLQFSPEGTVCCPKMLFLDSPNEIWFAGGEVDRKTMNVTHIGGHQQDGSAYDQLKQISFITFCCVLLPRAVIERVGLLNEQLFMYCEDVDYCLRLTDAGIPLWYIPQAKLWHKAGGSGGGALSMYYITRNTLHLRCKHVGVLQKFLCGLSVLIPGAVRYLATRLIGRPKGRSYGIFRGSLDFLKGQTGKMPERYLP